MGFQPAPDCPRLMDGDRRCGGRAFHTAGAATWKLRRLNYVLVEGTSMSWRSAERRFARPEMPVTGMQTLFSGHDSVHGHSQTQRLLFRTV